jgi:hypothetical protein
MAQLWHICQYTIEDARKALVEYRDVEVAEVR